MIDITNITQKRKQSIASRNRDKQALENLLKISDNRLDTTYSHGQVMQIVYRPPVCIHLNSLRTLQLGNAS